MMNFKPPLKASVGYMQQYINLMLLTVASIKTLKIPVLDMPGTPMPHTTDYITEVAVTETEIIFEKNVLRCT